MKKIIIILFTACITLAVAQNKRALDINFDATQDDNKSFSKTTSYSSRQISNDKISATLIDAGYYTLGTVAGLSAGSLDDNCPLSYGHPYAMTSYPVFSIDGSWYTMDSFFPGESSFVMHTSADSLTLNLTLDNLISIKFSISIEGDSYELYLQSANLDTMAHNIGLGFVYDPTLGSGGDGALFVADQYITHETTFETSLSSLAIWERSQSARGLGLNVQFDEQAQVIAANWPQIYETDDPVLLAPHNIRLYDLALKMYWPETEVSKQEDTQVSMRVKLQQPDFSSAVFTRWDLPLFLSLEDNIMFPREFSTFMKVASTQNNTFPNSYIKLEFPGTISSNTDSYNLPVTGSTPSYKEIKMQSTISYEEKVVGITASILQGNEVLDTFNRLVYVPQTPITYSGLKIVDDSVSVANFPQTDIIFALEKEETGRKILDLTEENIFLYENDHRINDFTFDKFGGGGSNLADVAFVLDVSGSMGDEITAVRNNIGGFADSLAARGYDYRIGIVTFSTTVDHVWDFTDNIDQIKNNLASISLWGGIEDSPAALYRASQLSYREGSKRTIIWITDEPYPEDSYTQQQVVNRMLDMGIVVNGVGLTSLQTDWFNPILIPTGGNFYDINGNFKDILLDVSNMDDQTRYILSYQSQQQTVSIDIKLEIHYAGLGIIKDFSVEPGEALTTSFAKLLCYPNPFNPAITFSIGSTDYKQGSLTIYNVLGQAVKQFNLREGLTQVTWQAGNDLKNPVSTGFYYVALKLVDQAGNVHHQKSKILYLK
jgi:Mg-chelatase subunit ChlD